ncbi:hypothetical protein J4558_20365 [Leptolyngbya sp. 15MV]|nr:hypothetical protein J4558_20365 [Leptolyngbya sp. 15MV]
MQDAASHGTEADDVAQRLRDVEDMLRRSAIHHRVVGLAMVDRLVEVVDEGGAFVGGIVERHHGAGTALGLEQVFAIGAQRVGGPVADDHALMLGREVDALSAQCRDTAQWPAP